jgi:signal recognition particle receptor subunit beta
MIIDALEKIITLKVVYYGPALSGKTTSLFALFKHFGKEKEVESIESTVKRTLFFDYGTISFQNESWKLKLHLYSTTGQDFYIVTRPITLTGVDGLIFVADSQKLNWERNKISWNELNSFFKERLLTLPILIAFNKQDLPNKFNPAAFLKEIQYFKYNNIDTRKTTAINGEGILESFEDILRLILRDLYKSELSAVLN